MLHPIVSLVLIQQKHILPQSIQNYFYLQRSFHKDNTPYSDMHKWN